MKLQVDTTLKTITTEGDVNLEELMTALEDMLPNGRWKKYKLITNNFINYSVAAPIIPQPYVYPDPLPWVSPYGQGTGDYTQPGWPTISDQLPKFISSTSKNINILDDGHYTMCQMHSKVESTHLHN